MLKTSQIAKKEGYRVKFYTKVTSTNDVAIKYFQDSIDLKNLSDIDKFYIISQEQTKGRGRRGHFWYSPKGNLYLSLIMRYDFVAKNIAQLTFVASLTIIEALKKIADSYGIDPSVFSLKWPNDVLLDGKKISGCMVEISHYKNYSVLIIGVGINVSSSYNNGDYPTLSLHDYGIMSSLESVFEEFSTFWAKNFLIWTEKNGETSIRKEWLKHTKNLGKKVSITCDNQIIHGIFKGIDENDHLILQQENGTLKTISSGHILL